MSYGTFPTWLHNLSIAWIALGAFCAIATTADEARHPQKMWIMNLVWSLTALFGTVFWLAGYCAWGRSASTSMANSVGRAGCGRRRESGHRFNNGVADRYVWVHGHRLVPVVQAALRWRCESHEPRVLVRNAACHARTIRHQLSRQLVADSPGCEGEDVNGSPGPEGAFVSAVQMAAQFRTGDVCCALTRPH
jgi:hypothetical protein